MKVKCDKHGVYEAETLNIFGCQITSPCPECSRILAEQEKQEKAEQEYLKELWRREGLIKRGIEPEYFEVTLDNFRAETESETIALEGCRKLVSGELQKLILLGPNGCGKTHLASALALELDGCVVTMYKLGSMIRAGYSEGKSELDILDDILRYKFIAFDEVGRTKGSEAEMNWLSYLIDKAHVRGIKIMLISNRPLARNLPEGRRGESFDRYLPNDVISRLRQRSLFVEIKGRDRRAAVMAIQ